MIRRPPRSTLFPYTPSFRSLRQRAADEIPVLLQHPLQAEIIGAGVAVQLRGGHVTLLDAQRVERIEAVGRYTEGLARREHRDRKSTRLNSSHDQISYAVFCL